MELEEMIKLYVNENGLEEAVKLISGEGYDVILAPKLYIGEQVREDRDDPDNYKDQCYSLDTSNDAGWVCTRRKEHSGPHIAGVSDNTIISVW